MKSESLHYETVKPLLLSVLRDMMDCPLFVPFRLVGGTALSLQCGHRMSDDIDLFSDASYDSLDFKAMQEWLYAHFWDLHELHDRYTLSQMLDWYEERNPYTAERSTVIAGLTDFTRADTEVDPRCLKGKFWQLIKLDISEWVQSELK